MTIEQLSTVISAFHQLFPVDHVTRYLLHFYHAVFHGEGDEAKAKKVASRLMKILREWVLLARDDFTEVTRGVLKQFLTSDDVMSKYPEPARAVQRALAKRLELFPFPRYHCVVYTLGGYTPQNMFSQYDAQLICDQISLVAFKLYKSVKPSEFALLAWTKPALYVHSTNLVRLMEHSNDLAHLTAMAVILPEKLVDRQDSVKRLLGLAKALLECHNFASLSGILTGLNMAACSRMKFTFALNHKWTAVLLLRFLSPSHLAASEVPRAISGPD